jgi:branched-chain amino acid transport system substrate-binding protein
MRQVRARALAFLCVAAVAQGAAAKVLIGVAGPTSGPYAALGNDVRRGARLAIERVNAAGGIDGDPLEVVEADDRCTQKDAEEEARRLVASGVVLVVGHPCAGAATAAAKIYAQAGIVFIAPATRGPTFTEARAGPVIFRLAGREDRQGAEAGAYITRNFAGQPVAVIHDGSRLGKSLAADAMTAVKPAVPSVLAAAIIGGQKDYTALIGKLRTAGARAVYYTGYAIEGGQLLRQMRIAGLDAGFLGSDVLTTAPFADAAGDKAEGALALLAHDASADIPADMLKDRFAGQPVSNALVSTYAALEAWSAAAKRAHSTAASAVSAGLASSASDTVLGPVSFDAKGDANLPSFDIVIWRDGAWRRQQ